MSSDNFHVVRKHPRGGFTYVTGLASHDIDKNYGFMLDIPVKDSDPKYERFNDALIAAMEDYSEYGIITHPECGDDDLGVKGSEGTD
jgi:hypothetical protein